MATINLRVDDELKEESKEILDSLGLDLSSGIKLFLKQVVIKKGIPFDVSLRKSDIASAIEDIEQGRYSSFNSIDDLMKDLDNGD